MVKLGKDAVTRWENQLFNIINTTLSRASLKTDITNFRNEHVSFFNEKGKKHTNLPHEFTYK